MFTSCSVDPSSLLYYAAFMLVEGREAWLTWLFYLELLWFLMKLSFLFEQTTSLEPLELCCDWYSDFRLSILCLVILWQIF